MSDKELVALITRQTVMLTGLAGLVSSLITIVEPMLEKCRKEGCSRPATVKHVDLHTLMCDECSAKTIVNMSRSFAESSTQDPADALNSVRAAAMDESRWEDTVHAKHIRKLTQYLNILSDLDGEEPTIQ